MGGAHIRSLVTNRVYVIIVEQFANRMGDVLSDGLTLERQIQREFAYTGHHWDGEANRNFPPSRLDPNYIQ